MATERWKASNLEMHDIDRHIEITPPSASLGWKINIVTELNFIENNDSGRFCINVNRKFNASDGIGPITNRKDGNASVTENNCKLY